MVGGVSEHGLLGSWQTLLLQALKPIRQMANIAKGFNMVDNLEGLKKVYTVLDEIQVEKIRGYFNSWIN